MTSLCQNCVAVQIIHCLSLGWLIIPSLIVSWLDPTTRTASPFRLIQGGVNRKEAKSGGKTKTEYYLFLLGFIHWIEVVSLIKILKISQTGSFRHRVYHLGHFFENIWIVIKYCSFEINIQHPIYANLEQNIINFKRQINNSQTKIAQGYEIK